MFAVLDVVGDGLITEIHTRRFVNFYLRLDSRKTLKFVRTETFCDRVA